jgi:predicted ATPase
LQGRLKNIDASLALAEECILLGQKTELPIFILSSMLRQGWGQALQGKTEGLTQIKTCIERMRKAMGGIIVAFHAVFAEALLYHGQAEEALSVVNESLAECEKKNDHHIEAELHRLKGEALMQLARPDEAEICFERALQISRDQGAKSLELRAASSIARLWRQQGKPADAKRVLEEIYSWFTEGFDTPDLQEAANLLSTMD